MAREEDDDQFRPPARGDRQSSPATDVATDPTAPAPTRTPLPPPHSNPAAPRFQDPPPGPRQGGSVWPTLVTLVLLAAVAGGAYYWWTHYHEKPAASETPAGQGAHAGAAAGVRGGRRGGGGPVPVAASAVTRGNLDLYIDGLGTVAAFNTVTIRSRVDGQLINVAYTEGQHVNQGDLLAEIDPRPFQTALEQAQGQLARDQAQLNNAQLDLQRYQEAGTAVTKQQLDTQAALVRQDQGVVQTDQAAVDNAKLQLSYTKITSPITGRVGLRPVDVGNMIHASDAGGLAVVTQLQPISVLFSIPQAQLPRVLKQTRAGKNLSVDAYTADNRTRIATGTLAAIDNQVDPANGMIRLKATFANEDEALFPSQFVNARLRVETLQGVDLAPVVGVQRGADNATFAWVVKPDDTVEMRPITTGPTQGDRVVITAGLNPGDVIVTDGVDKLVQGSKVSLGKPTGATPRNANAAGARRGNRQGVSTTAPAASRQPSPEAAPADNTGGGHRRSRPAPADQ